MAVRSPTMEARRLASPALKALMSRRTAELGGIALGLAGLAILVMLVSYDPRDPSLNTATPRHANNLVGPPGAMIADLLLQGFGLAGILPAVALLAWAWRIASHRGIGSMALRLAALLAALPVLAGLFATIPSPAVLNWPSLAGFGGAIGHVLAQSTLEIGRSLAGPVGAVGIWIAGAALSVALTFLALGLSRSEWRVAGRAARRVAGASMTGGRGLASVAMRGAGSIRAPSSWVSTLTRSTPAMHPDDATAATARAPEIGPDDYEDVDAPPPRMTRTAAPRRSSAPTHEEPVARMLADRTGAPPAAPVVIKRDAGRQARPTQGRLDLNEPGWHFPDLSLLERPPARINKGPTEEALQANARLLETVLDDYGVKGAIVEIRPGPVVTLYELEPAPGIRSARVIGLADDVARSLSVTAVRIATVPGRNVIGIEVPNAKRETVYLSEILTSEEVQKNAGRLSLALGKDIGGTTVVADLARMPHLMIAGTTGSGKSVGVNAMILSLLYRLSPDQCRLILIDPKMLELSIYEGIPHLMAPVVTEPAKAVTALKWVVREMERRYRAMSQLGVRNIGGYNDRVAEARAKGEVVTRRVQTGFDPDTGRPTFEEQPLALETLPFIVVVVDEMADLMMVAGKEIEAAVQRL
ncbi:MAG: DNA translocase FtsK 4TM domain-containing protein, partial [Acetobacteraceae bacterium]